MMEKLIALYEKGAITADHLAVEALQRLDPAQPGRVLETLPPAVLRRLLNYAREYQVDKMRTNYGVPPALNQVRAAEKWMASSTGGVEPVRIDPEGGNGNGS
jgi:hypothetical protein